MVECDAMNPVAPNVGPKYRLPDVFRVFRDQSLKKGTNVQPPTRKYEKCENAKMAENSRKCEIRCPKLSTGQPSALGKRAALAALGSDWR